MAAAVDVTAFDCVGGGLRRRVARVGGAEAAFGHVAGGTEVLEGMSAHNHSGVKNPEMMQVEFTIQINTSKYKSLTLLVHPHRRRPVPVDT